MQAKSHSPERTCIGCMQRDAQSALVRIATVNGAVEADFAGRKPGRGGYLHRSNECIERFLASRVKEFRSLRRRIERDQRAKIAAAIRDRLDRKIEVEYNN